MTSNRSRNPVSDLRRAARGMVVAAALFLGVTMPAGVLASQEHDAMRLSQLAMSTASMWMLEQHQDSIERSLAAGDRHEAKHEAEELIPWMKGTAWVPELQGAAREATEAVERVVVALDGSDDKAAKAAVEAMGKSFHHLHHELMEAVSGGHGHGHGEGHEKKKH